ncbi:testis specific, 14 [Trypanosoma rangeli]|uniref:Testis specific, 14 n=1 Tax=Trypanosoma rangeli TaxID=5698 RepID=A0A422N4N2_TRYRA|nr:testis specific, 14 [Trypanosoma rangeli]RNF00382.1 testis specific, 14 [Trypanosoma rangeli]|eukprot:RNF00382.1 testis specific, 14 [Trypanosoma rangeli]
MSVRETIGEKDFLLRRTPANPKYEKVKAVVESGLTVEVAQFMKRAACNVRRYAGESFLRMHPNVLAEYISKLKRQEERKKGCESDGGFLHPMDEYMSPNVRPEKEYLILDVRSEEEYKACHIEGALHYPKRRMLHAINPLLPEMFEFKNKENKYIVVYDTEEELTVGQSVGTVLFEKGLDNVVVLTGGLREFVQDYSFLIVGKSPVPIVPRDTRLQKRAEAISAARSETQRSAFSHKPKSLSNSLAKPRRL